MSSDPDVIKAVTSGERCEYCKKAGYGACVTKKSIAGGERALKADLLIVDNKIARIDAQGIKPESAETTVIDCTGKIVSPGFVDTHHHMWQTQLRGRHANDLFLDYMPKGNLAGKLFTPEDIFWGELGGVPGGHRRRNDDGASRAISATAASGIRSYFCYCPTMRLESWSTPLQFSQELMPDWLNVQLASLAEKQPFGDGRVRLGFAFEGYFLPQEYVSAIFEKVRASGVKLITSHYGRGPYWGQSSVVGTLSAYGLLKDDILLSHANGATPEDARLLTEANVHTSSTPDTELQMALGMPVCFRDDMISHASLGVDCHTSNSGILSQMRLALQSARGTTNQTFVAAGKVPRSMKHTAEEAFNLGTIKGARAVAMESEIGSIAVGKLADLVIWDGESPALVCAAEHDPVAAIVLHASVGDIDTVIVDGKIRKRGGKLVPVDVGDGKTMEWKEVAKELLVSRARIEKEHQKLDFAAATAGVMQLFQISPETLVDSV
ncbi:Metallo-dependent hydrolase [Mycena kentingensis (nom. inval.)]|nr:Metallo-dependent hydrolase [Mycena kentingensis (nom. inval.)]